MEARGASGGLGIIWNPRSILFCPIAGNRNWLLGKVISKLSKLSFTLINIYGPIPDAGKHKVWSEISFMMGLDPSSPVILGGDFNAILNLSEKKGGIRREPQSLKDFREWVAHNNLIDIETSNGVYTWYNRRSGFTQIAERLDRFLFRGNLSDLAVNLSASLLPSSGSDHYPVILNIEGEATPRCCPFKFEKMWMQNPDFYDLVARWWSEVNFQGSKMFCLVNKLKHLKSKLLKWNNEVFGNIFETKISLEKEIADLNEKVFRLGMDQDSFLKEKELLGKYEETLTKEEIFWKQKSREN